MCPQSSWERTCEDHTTVKCTSTRIFQVCTSTWFVLCVHPPEFFVFVRKRRGSLQCGEQWLERRAQCGRFFQFSYDAVEECDGRIPAQRKKRNVNDRVGQSSTSWWLQRVGIMSEDGQEIFEERTCWKPLFQGRAKSDKKEITGVCTTKGWQGLSAE